MKMKVVWVGVATCIVVGAVGFAGRWMWARRVRVLPVVNVKILRSNVDVKSSGDIHVTPHVFPLDWEVGEQKLCSTMFTAVEVVSQRPFPMLLCGDSQYHWSDPPSKDSAAYTLLNEPVNKAIIEQERWFPVRFLGKGSAMPEISNKGYVLWKCAKHVDGQIDCEW